MRFSSLVNSLITKALFMTNLKRKFVNFVLVELKCPTNDKIVKRQEGPSAKHIKESHLLSTKGE
jgi:hypothetical protein